MKVKKIEEELNRCLILFEYTGLQYFSLKSLTQSNVDSRPSILRTIYMLVLFVFVNAMAVSYILLDHSAVKGALTSKNVIMFVVKHSMNVAMVIILSVSFVQSYTSTRHIKKVYLNTKEIARLCSEFKLDIDFKQIRNDAWKRVAVMISFIFLMHGSVMLAHRNSPNSTLQLLLGILPIFFLLMIVYKFVMYVDMVNSQLRLLERLFMDVFQYQPIKILENGINVQLKHVEPSKPFNEILNKLRVVWKIYNVIFDNGSLINDSLGLTVLTLLIGLVIALTVSGYEVFVTIVGGRPVQNLPGNSILLNI